MGEAGGPKARRVGPDVGRGREVVPGRETGARESVRRGWRGVAAAARVALGSATAMHELEAYVLNARPKLDDQWRDFVDDAAKESFSQLLSDAENWLYDHWEETLAVYTAKLDEVSAVGDPIKYHPEQAEKRPAQVPAPHTALERVHAADTSGPAVANN